MMRAIASLAPPAAVGTTMVMVFAGHPCASAWPEAVAKSAMESPASQGLKTLERVETFNEKGGAVSEYGM